MSSKNNQRVRSGSIIRVVVALCLITGAVFMWTQRQSIHDWMIVQQYTPSSEIQQLAERASFSDKGTFYFYTGEPQIDSADQFNLHCERREESSALLGCYSNGRIYLYRVTADTLQGIEEVTAAHEMLHAAWDRLSEARKKQLSTELEQTYDAVKTPELEERMAYYERQQPGSRINELHSILATEIASLPDSLEQYYRQYFTDRAHLVGLHDTYASVFRALEEKAVDLRAQLTSQAETINSLIALYNADMEQLNSDMTAHNQRATAVDRTSSEAVAAYNASRAVLVSRATELEGRRQKIEQQTARYNQTLQTYNALEVQTATLSSSLDSMSQQAAQ